MIATPIKTPKITANQQTLIALLDQSLQEFPESSVLAVTSKVVSLCEGRIIATDSASKQEIVQQEADLYIPKSASKYGTQFTITKNTLVPNAGIDESNAGNVYVLWPKDPVATANTVRGYLKERFKVRNAGVIITDSTSRPFRLGATGIALGFSGFEPVHEYTGEKDLFGREFTIESSDILGGLSAAAVLVMGEGAEQTPLALLHNLPFVRFKDTNPTQADISTLNISVEDDLYAPFIDNVAWLRNT